MWSIGCLCLNIDDSKLYRLKEFQEMQFQEMQDFKQILYILRTRILMLIPIFILCNLVIFLIYSDNTSNLTVMGNADTVEESEYLFTSKVYIEPIIQQKTYKFGEGYQVSEKVITYGDEFLLSEININEIIETLKNSHNILIDKEVLKDIKNSVSRSNNFVTLSTSYFDRNLAQLFHENLVLSYSKMLDLVFNVLNSANQSDNSFSNHASYLDGKVVVIENAIASEIKKEPIIKPSNYHARWISVRIVISLLLSSLISIVFLMFIEVRDKTITSTGQLKSFIDRNRLLGWIPLYKKGILSIDFISACINGIETSEKERFLEIGANLENRIDFQKNKIFLLCGTSRGEGKSLLTYLLGYYFSQDKNICILEFNNSWEITSQYTNISIKFNNGKNYSGKELSLKNRKIHLIHFDFNSIEDFKNYDNTTLEELKCKYDMLFIEAPSLSSQYLLSQYLRLADQVILPIRIGVTRSDNFNYLAQLCEQYQLPPWIVLNGIVPSLQPHKSIVRIQNSLENGIIGLKKRRRNLRVFEWSKIVYALFYKQACN